MKKVLGIFLAVALLVQMTACNTMFPFSLLMKDRVESNSSSSAVESEESEAVSPDSMAPEKETSSQVEQPDFNELTLIDNDECAIVLTGIEPDNTMGYTLQLRLENKSEDKNYMFSVLDATVNGLKSDPYFASEVAAGKKANEELWFDSEELAAIGLVDFTDIQLFFNVYDSDDWAADAVAEETVHIYPNGEASATTYTRKDTSSDVVLVDNDYVKVVAIDAGLDDIWGYQLNLFFVNKTDTTVMFATEDEALNGYMADPYFAMTVPAGCSAFDSVDWGLTTLEENAITDVETIELTLIAYDDEDYSADYFANTAVSLTVE